MSGRRGFVKQMATVLGSFAIASSIENSLKDGLMAAETKSNHLTPPEFAKDEEFWYWVRESYTVSPHLINLNNGGVAPQPKVTQDAQDKYNRMCNEGPSYYMWRILDAGREPLRENLADLAGCSAEEIAINRNSTEGLNTIIFGLNLKAGDEVVLSKQGYPNMINAWKQREKRDGIKLVWLNFDLPQEDDAYFVERYVSAFTDKTKVVHLTHMINWTGQVKPVAKIADEAHKRNIDVICDGAHSFALMDYKIPDLHCDYFATSLHKWMSAPFGSGLMYIKKDKIKDVWALLSNDKPDGDNIRKFESLGTRSFASEMAIGYSLDFHNMIGTARKQARLHFLKNYWAEKVKDIPKVKLNTSLDPKYACAIGNFSIQGMEPGDIDNKLLTKYKIHTVGINWENIHGVRVTPNVYTSLKDLDKLVRGIEDIAKNGTKI
ncbi:MAG: aminotransferase class V-fold PLP-dependent enzyme [Candidatus Kapabacteria bacterium]|nr:aminotransferase class V-fold PLP-dependent enzyme [Candidatus Kapabacteria bacterium]